MQKMRMMWDVYSPDAAYKGFAERKSFKSKMGALYHCKQIRRYGHAAVLILVGITSIAFTEGAGLFSKLAAMGEPPASWYASMAPNRGHPAAELGWDGGLFRRGQNRHG